MKLINKSIYLFLIIIFLSNSIYSATVYDPKLKWKTIETSHFLIHFHQGEHDLAQLSANLAEEIHNELYSFLQYKPKGKTHIVLVDNMDIANGYATIFPQKCIVIYVTPAESESFIGNYEHWIRTVLIHEYTHILHLDMIDGVPKLFRSFFGRAPLPFCFPNLFHPFWLIEGMAVLSETKFTSRGRGRASDWKMLLRTAVLEKRFLQIDQATGPLVAWPWWNSSYLYGNKFLEYLREKYGEEKIISLNKRTSRTFIPYFTDWAFKKTYGKSAIRLWKEWERETEKKLIPLKEKMTNSKTKEIQLTNYGYFIFGPRFSPDNKKIAYSVINPHCFPEIRIYDLETKKEYSLTDRYFGYYLCWAKNGKEIIFSQMEYYKNFYLYSDLYLYQFVDKRVKKLTKGLRVKAPDISPDGEKIVAVTNGLGTNDLIIIDKKGGDIKFITRNSEQVVYSSPRWSPQGDKIVVSKGKGGLWEILILTPEGEKIHSFSQNQARIISPCWSPDGKFIIFSSDRTGIFNLYAYSLVDGKLYQITDCVSGAFFPDVSPDGRKIVYTSYSSKGYDLFLMDFSPENWREPKDYNLQYHEISSTINEVEYTVKNYNPLKSLMPKFWIPSFIMNKSEINPGFMTLGYDVLQKHYYFLSYFQSFSSGKSSYDIDYIYDGLRPTFHFHLSQNKIKSDESKFFLKISYPFFKVKKRHLLFLEYYHEKNTYSELNSLKELKFDGLKLGWNYNSSRKYGYSISRTEGRIINFYYERDFKQLGSSYDTSRLVLEWREYFALPLKHHVIGLRFSGGISWGKDFKRLFFMGGYKGRGTLLENNSSYFGLLRGYPEEVFSGTRAILLNFEYRMPLLNIERGVGNFPVFFQRIHLGLFTDCGKTWNEDKFNFYNFKTGIGMEIRFDITLSYVLPLILSFGGAKGLDKEFGDSQFYFRIGSSF